MVIVKVNVSECYGVGKNLFTIGFQDWCLKPTKFLAEPSMTWNLGMLILLKTWHNMVELLLNHAYITYIYIYYTIYIIYIYSVYMMTDDN